MPEKQMPISEMMNELARLSGSWRPEVELRLIPYQNKWTCQIFEIYKGFNTPVILGDTAEEAISRCKQYTNKILSTRENGMAEWDHCTFCRVDDSFTEVFVCNNWNEEWTDNSLLE